MARRFRQFVLVLAIGCVLLTPQLILAEDGLTLESLAEKVGSLFQDQDDLNVRVAAIETSIAPTPTQTRRRPTATSTHNARATKAAQARATSQVRLTATAQAVKVRLTATARARATEEAENQLSDTEYLEVLTFNADMTMMAMEGLAAAFRRPQFGDSNWRTNVNMYLDAFPFVQESLVVIVPPPSLREGHDKFLKGIAYCVSGAKLIAEGVEKRKNSKFTEAAVDFEECTRITSEALILVGK